MAHLRVAFSIGLQPLDMLAGVKCAIDASGIAVKASTPWQLA